MQSVDNLVDKCQMKNSIMQRAKPALPILSARTHVPIKDRYGWPDTLDLIEYNKGESTHLPLNILGPSDKVVLKDKSIYYKVVTNIPEGRRDKYALY